MRSLILTHFKLIIETSHLLSGYFIVGLYGLVLVLFVYCVEFMI